MEEYYPDNKLKKYLQTIYGIYFLFFYISSAIVLLIFYAVYHAKVLLIILLVISIIEIPAAVCIFIWIPYYFKSIKYLVSEKFIRIQKGVIWKNLSTIPFAKVQNVEIIHGPIERNFGLGSIFLHTAGYSGRAAAKGVIRGIVDFQKLAAVLTEKVKNSSGSEFASKPESLDSNYLFVLVNIRNEIIEIRKILSEK